MNAAHLEFCGSPEWRQIVEEMVLPVALRDLELGDDVLEIGPGPGFTTDVLRTKTQRLTAVELDPALARDLDRRLAGTNVDVVQGDATALDFANDRFTATASFNMLHHVPSDDAQDRIFAELARVLRPGGLFVAADGVASEDLLAFHEGDTYHPIHPDGLAERLGYVGFIGIDVRLYDLGWIAGARTPRAARGAG
jgi:SAM-dependent methyltransferase